LNPFFRGPKIYEAYKYGAMVIEDCEEYLTSKVWPLNFLWNAVDVFTA
jgi:hypothetical protein